MNAPLTLSEQISSKILELRDSLLNQHPAMPRLLSEIHTTLKSNPACVTLLTEEEIGIVVAGLKKQTATEIAATVSKVRTKPMSKMTLEDF